MLCLSLTTAIAFQSCSDKEGCTDSAANNYDGDADEDDGSCTYTAGTGGNVTIVAYATHHGDTIINDSAYVDSVFVKFNTLSQPGVNASDYDLIVVGEAGEDHVHVEGLKRGKYFFYMTGWDPNSSPNRVTGGIPFEFTQTTGEIPLVIPVTE